MKSLVAALIFSLALPVFAQTDLEEAPGTPDLPPPPSAPSTGDLNDAVDQLSHEQKSQAPTSKPKSEMPPGSPVKHGKPFARHEKPKKDKKKSKKEKAAKKAAKSDKKKKKKKH